VIPRDDGAGTRVRFAILMVVGAVIYFAYSRRHSRLAIERETDL
jgi:hypothetical protein